MNIALLGLAQAGKRTLFSLLTGRAVPDNRKPGEAVEGVARIRDERVDALSALCRPERTVYAENHFMLCPDAVEGEGGREWLDAARQCDLLCLVVRGFSDPSVFHPRGSVDAARDAAQLRDELVLADLERVEKRLERLAKEKRSGRTPQQAAEERALEKCRATLEAGGRADAAELADEDRAAVGQLQLLTLIPALTLYNVDEADVTRDFGPAALTVSARIEREIMAIEDPAERREYLTQMGLNASGLDRVNAVTYDALGLMSFYTIGEDEVRAWTIRKGFRAPQAAGRIHKDLERGFIRAEVIKYDDLIAAGSEAAARRLGKVQTRGKDYVMEDGDICHFLFSV